MTRNHDYFFSSDEALELGIIDGIDSKGVDLDLFAEKVYGIPQVEEIEESGQPLSEEDFVELFPTNVE